MSTSTFGFSLPQPDTAMTTTASRNPQSAVAPASQPASAYGRLANLLPGVMVSGALAGAGIQLGHVGWLQDHGFSALTLAIVLGMLVGNTVYPCFAKASGAGVSVAARARLS